MRQILAAEVLRRSDSIPFSGGSALQLEDSPLGRVRPRCLSTNDAEKRISFHESSRRRIDHRRLYVSQDTEVALLLGLGDNLIVAGDKSITFHLCVLLGFFQSRISNCTGNRDSRDYAG